VHDYLLFSDPNANIIYRLDPTGRLVVFRNNSGLADYAGIDIAKFAKAGANGNTLDSHGRLTTCEMGNRRITRTECDATIAVLTERYEGKRFNSPNDLVYKSDGSLYFTDPLSVCARCSTIQAGNWTLAASFGGRKTRLLSSLKN
jgi:gluconolactonase